MREPTRRWKALAIASAAAIAPAVSSPAAEVEAGGAPSPPAAGRAAEAPAERLPFVYTKWRQFTKADGLVDDHIFAVKSDGPRIWVGSEGGLSMIDKATGAVRNWTEADGLPFRVVSAIATDPRTGDVWIGMFGGGLARLSGGRFEHWNQLNSGLVNDVVYGVAVEGDNVWAATTAGASRFDTRTGQWTIFNEKNAPMEEIWNYGVSAADGKVHLAVWGSGVLEYDVASGRWKEYLDPDGEMEIDLYRDDGIVHVIVTGASYVEKTLWASTYFGVSRYDGRHWRGFYAQDSGLPSDFTNNLAGRSAQEAWFATDKGLGVLADAESDTWVAYTRSPDGDGGRAVVTRGKAVLETIETGVNVPHSFIIAVDLDGDDAFVGTAKGLGWAIGDGYYPRLGDRPPGGTPGAPAAAGASDGPPAAGSAGP